MTVKIKDEELYGIYLSAIYYPNYFNESFSTSPHENTTTLWDKCNCVNKFLEGITAKHNMDNVKKVVNAILDDEKVVLEEPKYNLIVFEDNQAHDYYCAFYKREGEIFASGIVNNTHLHGDACQFTQEEIDNFQNASNVYVDLNSIKIPVEEANDNQN